MGSYRAPRYSGAVTTLDRSASGSLFGGTAIVGGLTAFSRVLGFVRDLLIARLFGASLAADMFLVAFRIPNLLRRLVAEGALTVAFVPIYTEYLKKSRKEAPNLPRPTP